MWILKGTLLGLWLAGVGTMAYFYFAIFRQMPPHSAVGVSAFSAHTIHNPFWWTALLTCFALGFAITRVWTIPVGMWVAVAVTGAVPAGFLTLLVVYFLKVKQASHN